MNLATLRAMKPQILAIAVTLSLSACVAPTTATPKVSAEEFKAEQAAQAAAAKSAPIDFNEKKPYGHLQVSALAARLEPIARRVEDAASDVCRDMATGSDCDFEVILDDSKRGLNAHADGQNVVIYPAMIDFAKNDNHLAFVIAHEFAHNIMQHVQSQQQNIAVGTLLGSLADVAAGAAGASKRAIFGKIGQSQGVARYSTGFENEADYVGLYILARAGFNIEQAPDFWRIMSQANPDAIYISTTHPSNPKRTIAMGKAVAEIRAKQKAGAPLIPSIRPKK